MFFGINNSKFFSVLFLSFMIFFVGALTLTLYAEEADSEKNPLLLTGYRMNDLLIEEGQRSTEIELYFSKNVVNMMVSENNKKCFRLLDNKGSEIPIQVEMADDQIERERRHIIKISIQNIEPLKDYKLMISSDLEAKNGIKLKNQIEMAFTTLGIIK